LFCDRVPDFSRDKAETKRLKSFEATRNQREEYGSEQDEDEECGKFSEGAEDMIAAPKRFQNDAPRSGIWRRFGTQISQEIHQRPGSQSRD
jgi:hypothetical protein